MDGKYGVTRHFFKFMLPGFLDKLVLPPAFCRKLKEENLEHAILTSHQGRKKVNVCKNINGLIIFKEGWKDFAYQNDLSIGDVIVFEHTGGLHFNAIVFDSTACEKQFPEEVNLDEHPEDAEGWYKFYKSNKLKDGDFCIFELHTDSPRSKTVVMDVQISRHPP
ncbi:hypothetical protein CDL12_10932 [Handroanthus impetiginosus]|uniref:TF-B3 domain-containing protein n=1 Tax=Handroanthus impetiginosus TaxID=429701 RepID=A0A2G9HFW9_9LAMI|nr:hypothetical protein CDL12_10932 [Handroanthus impetiginosus]